MKRGHEFKSKEGYMEGFEGGKGRRKQCSHISKKKKLMSSTIWKDFFLCFWQCGAFWESCMTK